MFYKYSGMSGRIVPTSQLAAYQPQGLIPYSGKATQLVFDSSRTQPLRESEAPFRGGAPVRGAASAPAGVPTSSGTGNRGNVPATAAYRKVMEMQNLMTRDDGKMVWQKFGRDRIGYGVTMSLTAVGTVMVLALLWKMSFPKKKEE